MFGKKKKKKKGVMDKLVIGAIVGGAIGSVVGMSVAPKKGEETRQYLKNKGTEVYDKAKDFIEEHEVKKEGNKVWRGIKKIFKKG